MKILTCGIVTNQYGHVLLIQRDDSLTWAAPGGLLEHGELPTAGVVREVREETGLIVMPVRLVTLDFVPGKTSALLSMTFRCIQRGGAIKSSAESLQVGWIKGNDLPRSMLSYHRERIEQALTHNGGPAIWRVEQNGFGNRLNRLKRAVISFGKPKAVPSNSALVAPDWEVETAVVIQNNKKETLWVNSGNRWVLPGGLSNGKQPPWETAVRATQNQTGHTPTLTTLAAVFSNENKLTFVFFGSLSEKALSQIDTHKLTFQTPDNADQRQLYWINATANVEDITIFG